MSCVRTAQFVYKATITLAFVRGESCKKRFELGNKASESGCLCCDEQNETTRRDCVSANLFSELEIKRRKLKGGLDWNSSMH